MKEEGYDTYLCKIEKIKLTSGWKTKKMRDTCPLCPLQK